MRQRLGVGEIIHRHEFDLGIMQTRAHDIGIEADIVADGAAGDAAVEFSQIDIEIFELDAPLRPHRIFNTGANRIAQLLAQELGRIPQFKITQKVEANGVFAVVPKKYIAKLQKKYFFYVWNEQTSEVRFMTSFDTTEEDIADFVGLVKRTLK